MIGWVKSLVSSYISPLARKYGSVISSYAPSAVVIGSVATTGCASPPQATRREVTEVQTSAAIAQPIGIAGFLYGDPGPRKPTKPSSERKEPTSSLYVPETRLIVPETRPVYSDSDVAKLNGLIGQMDMLGPRRNASDAVIYAEPAARHPTLRKTAPYFRGLMQDAEEYVNRFGARKSERCYGLEQHLFGADGIPRGKEIAYFVDAAAMELPPWAYDMVQIPLEGTSIVLEAPVELLRLFSGLSKGRKIEVRAHTPDYLEEQERITLGGFPREKARKERCGVKINAKLPSDLGDFLTGVGELDFDKVAPETKVTAYAHVDIGFAFLMANGKFEINEPDQYRDFVRGRISDFAKNSGWEASIYLDVKPDAIRRIRDAIYALAQ